MARFERGEPVNALDGDEAEIPDSNGLAVCVTCCWNTGSGGDEGRDVAGVEWESAETEEKRWLLIMLMARLPKR